MRHLSEYTIVLWATTPGGYRFPVASYAAPEALIRDVYRHSIAHPGDRIHIRTTNGQPEDEWMQAAFSELQTETGN